MRPPICDVCGEFLADENGGLVRFTSRPSDLEWRERAAKGQLVGHPPDTGWFCAQHVERARSLISLTYSEALAEMVPPVTRPPAPPPMPAPAPAPETTPQPSRENPGQRRPPVEPVFVTDDEAASLIRHGISDFRPARTYFPGQDAAVIVPIRRISLGALVDILVAALPQFALALGAPEPPPLTSVVDRSWSPMDGSVAPNCPFSDEIRRTAQVGDYEYVVNNDVSYWNEDAASNGGCHLSITYQPGGDPDASDGWSVRISAGSHDVSDSLVHVDTITVWQPLPDAYVAVLADMVAVLR